MARTRRKDETEAEASSSQSRPGALKAILVLTLAIVAVALAMLGWNRHQAEDLDALRILQRDALLTAERLNRKADDASTRLAYELRSGARIASIDAAHIGVDRLIGLDAAVGSEDETDLALAEYATELISSGQRLGQMNDGRLVFVFVPAVGPSVISTVAPQSWLSAPSGDARLVLHGRTSSTYGNKSVLPPSRRILARGHGFRLDGITRRSATACIGLEQADFSLCLSEPAPLLTLENGLELLLYIMLLAAPSLAIYGLYQHVGRSEKEKAAEPEPQRPLSSRFEEAAATASVGFWTLHPGNGTAWVNEEAAQLLGLPHHGNWPISAFYRQVYSPHQDHVQDAVDQARPSQAFSAQFATAPSNGEQWLEVRGSQVYSDDGATAQISGAMFDVTAAVRTREKQKSSEAKLRNAIENFPCPFALWDRNKRLAYWNKSFETIFGLDDVLRTGVSYETVLLARSGNVIAERNSALDSGVTVLGLRNGDWIKFVERSAVAGGLISFGVDVTSDVRNEEQLTQQKKKLKDLVQDLERSEGHNAELAHKYNEEKARAERSAHSKSAFLANMSHELRTPLNAINGFSEILVNEMYGPLGDKRYIEYAGDILASGQHLLDMINDILDIAKIEAGKMTIDPKPIDLVDPVDAAVRMIRRKAEDKGVQLSLQAEDALPEVDADHRAVRQMVLNLLSNAIKFTDAGGRIMVAVQRKDDYVRVAVRDTGVGIPKEHLPRLAQPFEQVQETRERNYDGTGLGLALTKSFAEMHGGRFTIASEVGKGTMVSFYLPVSTEGSDSGRYVA